MNPSFSSREQEIRQLGKKIEVEVAQGNEPNDFFERVLRLPVSDFTTLQDTMLSLCEARLGGSDTERIARLENFGATTVRYLGLFFDRETINEEFIPRLLERAPSVQDESPEAVENRSARYERIIALAQLAPRMDQDLVEPVLETCLELASHDDGFLPDLLLPLANFERTYRERGEEEPNSLIDRSRVLCLESVREILDVTVTALSEADQDSLNDAMAILPLLHTAGVSLLTILPSVAHNNDPVYVAKMTEILDHSEWLLSRGEGFPGNFVTPAEIAIFDSVRSVFSLCSAMMTVYSAEHSSTISRMRVAKREGPHRVGTVALELARRRDQVDGMSLIRDLVHHHLEVEASPQGKPLSLPALLEVSALAWHLDVGKTSLINAVLQRIRDPRGQFYLHKTLEGAPWG